MQDQVVVVSAVRIRRAKRVAVPYARAVGDIAALHIHALTHALAVTLAGRARVNSISPGWINCGEEEYTGADALQQPAGRVGTPDDIADLALFLCSDMAGFITGEDIAVDGGMTKLMVYHGDHGWQLNV